MEPDSWIVWVFEHFGCFARDATRQKALAKTPKVIADYHDWLEGYDSTGQTTAEQVEVELIEEHTAFISEDDFIVNAFFEHDRRLLTDDDVYHVAWLFECTRNDLMQVIRKLDTERLDRPIEEEVQKSIRGVIRHIALSERWCFDKIDLAQKRSTVPDDIFAALESVRAHSLRQLPSMVGNDTIGHFKQEVWSARKVLRRALWHERTHTQQIARYLGQL